MIGPEPAGADCSGSGKLGSPWLRMHRAKASAAATCRFEGLIAPGPPPGSFPRHAFCAAWNAGDCGWSPDPGPIWIPPPEPGSGKFVTPCARMHFENPRAWAALARGEVPVPPDAPDPPQAARPVAAQSAGMRARAVRIGWERTRGPRRFVVLPG